MTDRPPVLLAGMFDFDNYGDLLFPLVAQRRLASYGHPTIAVAPSAHRASFDDALPPIDITQMMLGQEPIAGVVIGGGYLIHANSLDLMEHYQTAGAGAWGGVGLWLGATLAAALRDAPIAWNAPGVPHPFSARQREFVIPALRAASYLSVRDRGAVNLLAPPHDIAISVVPDPIAEIASLWPRDSLRAAYERLLRRKGAPSGARLLAIHVRNRSMRGLDSADLGGKLKAFARRHGLVPMLIAVGRSHDDPATARQLAPHLGDTLLLLDDPSSLMEMTAALAYSGLYVGASLHGYVVSGAYGVPGVLVGRPAYQKFAGFLEHAGRMQDLAPDWPDALSLAAERAGEPTGPRWPATVFAALDDHWEGVRKALAAPQARAEARRDFALALLRQGIRNSGAGWAMQPFLNRVMRNVNVPRLSSNRETGENRDV